MSASIHEWLSPLAFLIIVMVLTACHFHGGAQHPPIRFASLPVRYVIGLSAYVFGGLLLALLLVSGITLAIVTLKGGIELPDGDLPPGDVPTPFIGPDVYATATVVASALYIVLPWVPIVRWAIHGFRNATYMLARYPASSDLTTLLVASSTFRASDSARRDVEKALEDFGVPEDVIVTALGRGHDLLAEPAVRSLIELATLRRRFHGVLARRRLRAFREARSREFAELDELSSRIFRRTAAAVIALSDIEASDQSRIDLSLEVSAFLSEECDVVILRYQRLLADAALSTRYSPAGRTRMFRSFGYDVVAARPIPIIPIVVTICIIDVAFTFAPTVFLIDWSVVPAPIAIGTYGIVHAIALTMAIASATYPKAVSNLARPSLSGLPWPSYLVCGSASYLIGIALLRWFFSWFPPPPGLLGATYPLLASAIFASLFPVVTVVLSIRLDLRLRHVGRGRLADRLKDAVAVGIATAAVTLAMKVVQDRAASAFELRLTEFDIIVWATFVGVTGVLGFVLGYLVPSLAEDHLEAGRTIVDEASHRAKLRVAESGP